MRNAVFIGLLLSVSANATPTTMMVSKIDSMNLARGFTSNVKFAGGDIDYDLNQGTAGLTLTPAEATCTSGEMCSKIIAAPIKYEVTIVNVTTDDCGVTSIQATGNGQQLLIIDRSHLTCENSELANLPAVEAAFYLFQGPIPIESHFSGNQFQQEIIQN